MESKIFLWMMLTFFHINYSSHVKLFVVHPLNWTDGKLIKRERMLGRLTLENDLLKKASSMLHTQNRRNGE